MKDFLEIINDGLQKIPEANRSAISVCLYQARVVSIFEAAELLEVSTADFMGVLESEGISVFGNTLH